MRKILALAAFILVAHTTAHAQIIYRDIVPDKDIPKNDAVAVHIAKSIDSTTHAEDGSFILWNYDPGIFIVTYTGCQVKMDGLYPALIDSNDLIANSGTWASTSYAELYDGSVGHWANATNKYLGIRTMKNGQWHYGWVRMDVNAAGDGATLKAFAYEQTGGLQIRAGQLATLAVETFPQTVPLDVSISDNLLSIHNVSGNYTASVTDMTGKTILKRNLNEGSGPVSLQEVPAGIYVICVSVSQGKIRRQKIILY